MKASLQRLKRLCAPLPPCREVRVHASDKGGELGVLINGGLDGRLLHREVEIAGPVSLEQYIAEVGADGPIRRESIYIALRDSALQVAFDVLEVFRLLAIDVAGQVEVE